MKYKIEFIDINKNADPYIIINGQLTCLYVIGEPCYMHIAPTDQDIVNSFLIHIDIKEKDWIKLKEQIWKEFDKWENKRVREIYKKRGDKPWYII